MITDDNIKEKVFKRLNSEFGGDLKNFSKCKELLTKIGQEKDDIEKEVSGLICYYLYYLSQKNVDYW